MWGSRASRFRPCFPFGVRPLRGRDSVCPLSAGSLRSPAVRHGSASSRPLALRVCLQGVSVRHSLRYTLYICIHSHARMPRRGLRSCPTMLNRWRAARACGCAVLLKRASEKSNIRMWWVWMGIRPLRGRDNVCPLSAGSLRSPAVRQDSGLFEAVGFVAFRYTFII